MSVLSLISDINVHLNGHVCVGCSGRHVGSTGI
jgi:hypothetical protein